MTRAVTNAALGLMLVVALVVVPSGAAGVTGQLNGSVDLSIEVSAHPNPAPVGSVVIYEGVVRNRGRVVAEEVEGVFEIPAEAVTADADSLACTAVGSKHLDAAGSTRAEPWTVTCNLGALPPGAEIQVAFSVRTGAPGTHMSTATVSYPAVDRRPSDNKAEIPLLVLPNTPGYTPAFQRPGPTNPLGRTTV